jgi:hypothetical protein
VAELALMNKYIQSGEFKALRQYGLDVYQKKGRGEMIAMLQTVIHEEEDRKEN